MSNIIRNFLKEAPPALGLLKRGIVIHPSRMEQAVPGLSLNLRKSTRHYIDGLIQLDEEYLKNTSSVYLFNRLQKQINQLKTNPNIDIPSLAKNFSSKLQLDDNQKSSNQPDIELPKLKMLVYPYVIFGITLSQRIKQHPQQDIFQITRNRFISKTNLNTGVGYFLTNLTNQIVYGFKCQFYKQMKSQRLMSITFEGDVEKQEYYVSDLNHQLLAEEKQTKI